MMKAAAIEIPDLKKPIIIKKPTTMKEILNEFLLELSAIVMSKRCFNLYENCDTNQSNLITITDFEKQTRLIMPDLQPE